MWNSQQKITALAGRPPTWFRPGTAHYDDIAVQIVHELGLQPLGFTVNGDAGATAPAATVRSNVDGRGARVDRDRAHESPGPAPPPAWPMRSHSYARAGGSSCHWVTAY